MTTEKRRKKTTKISERESFVQFLAPANIKAGDAIALSHVAGISLSNVRRGGRGTAAIMGVFMIPKPQHQIWLSGEKLLWNSKARRIRRTARLGQDGDIYDVAIVFGGAPRGDRKCSVMLTPGRGTPYKVRMKELNERAKKKTKAR